MVAIKGSERILNAVVTARGSNEVVVVDSCEVMLTLLIKLLLLERLFWVHEEANCCERRDTALGERTNVFLKKWILSPHRTTYPIILVSVVVGIDRSEAFIEVLAHSYLPLRPL